MTSKEVLGLLASRVQVGAYKEEMQKCFDIVNKAINKLEKRDTPMKPIMGTNQKGKIDLICQSCSLDVVFKENFCSHCGQRLMW